MCAIVSYHLNYLNVLQIQMKKKNYLGTCTINSPNSELSYTIYYIIIKHEI